MGTSLKSCTPNLVPKMRRPSMTLRVSVVLGIGAFSKILKLSVPGPMLNELFLWAELCFQLIEHTFVCCAYGHLICGRRKSLRLAQHFLRLYEPVGLAWI